MYVYYFQWKTGKLTFAVDKNWICIVTGVLFSVVSSDIILRGRRSQQTTFFHYHRRFKEDFYVEMSNVCKHVFCVFMLILQKALIIPMIHDVQRHQQQQRQQTSAENT